MRSGDESSTASSQQWRLADDAHAAGSRGRPASTKKREDKKDRGAIGVRRIMRSGSEAVPTTFLRGGGTTRKGASASAKSEGNDLTHLIPGYTAPMRLEAKSLEGVAGASLAELRHRAARGDSRTYGPSVSILGKNEEAFNASAAAKKVKTPSSIAIQKKAGGRGGKIPTSFSNSFRKAPGKRYDNTAGAGWFGMEPTPMTDQLRTDLSIIRNRNYLDPKKFYKSADSFAGKVLQVGTVVEGSAEFYSSRLAKRDRRQNLTEEIMADANVSSYAKRKYKDLQADRAKPKKGKFKRGRKKR